jgi:hypothetical protein
MEPADKAEMKLADSPVSASRNGVEKGEFENERQ